MFDVITIGTATRDTFVTSSRFRTLKDAAHLRRLGFPTGEAECLPLGGKVEIERPIATVGGGAANAAVTFARQGFKTAAVAKIGRDEYGRAVVADLRREHVAALTTIDPGAPTASSVILLTGAGPVRNRSPRGGRSRAFGRAASNGAGERTILNYRGASEDLTLRDVPFRRLKARWAYIVPGRIPLSVITAFITKLKSDGTRVAMNPSKYYLELGAQRLAPILKQLDVVTLNREEAAYLTGKKYNDLHGLFRAFDELVPGFAVMTDGPKGVAVSDGRTIWHAGVFKEKKIVDRTGSGDAFGSGFVAGLIRFGRTPEGVEAAIRLGSANATSVVEAIGAQPGIITRRAFRTERRWQSFRVKQTKLIS
ncbi:MAG: carbohydrate kinase family protein [Patescibacteria group bacterium]